MRLVSSSTLKAYADDFWKRQRHKDDPNDRVAIPDIDGGGDSVAWLVNLYPYKLPKPRNRTVEIVQIESIQEVDQLLIHRGMIKDSWAVSRRLVPCPKSRRLGDMVTVALERDYFSASHPDTQIKIFRSWIGKPSTEGLIEEYGAPLIELTWPDEYEIVDGWGRLHAMSALVREGATFQSFTCFCASPNGIEQETGGYR